MKRSKPLKRKRPAVLVRFYPTDIARLNRACGERQTPRESYIRRCVLAQVSADLATIDRPLHRAPAALDKRKHKR